MPRYKRRRYVKRRSARYRKRRRKAVYNRRRRARAGSYRKKRISSRGLWSRSVKKVLTYADIISTDISSNNHFYYRANGMYDPDVAVGGHQPYGFDQMMTYYKHFHVIGARARMTVFPGDNNGIEYPMYLYGWIHDQATPMTAPGGFPEMVEYPHVKWKLKGPTANGPPLILSLNFGAKKLFERSDVLDVDFRGSAAADPSHQAYFCFGVASAVSQNPPVFNVSIEIDYIGVFTDPITFGQS